MSGAGIASAHSPMYLHLVGFPIADGTPEPVASGPSRRRSPGRHSRSPSRAHRHSPRDRLSISPSGPTN